MAYDDEHIIDPDEQSNFFEEDPAFGTDMYFGERLDAMRDDLDETDELDELSEEDTVSEKPDTTFGETLSQHDAAPLDQEEGPAPSENEEFDDRT